MAEGSANVPERVMAVPREPRRGDTDDTDAPTMPVVMTVSVVMHWDISEKESTTRYFKNTVEAPEDTLTKMFVEMFCVFKLERIVSEANKSP
jgi:hypothetical protein